MQKSQIVDKIRAARFAHIQWVQRAKSLVNGFAIKEEDIPLTADSCTFGSWFYSDGQVLLAIFNEKVVKEIETLHHNLHDEYFNIFKIYFDLSNLSFFQKLLQTKKQISDKEQKKAEQSLKRLEKISEELVKNLNIVETKINMADESMFEKYV
ncbi:MAG TPA: hypothetical protein ENK95_01005 [Campylobacterales bacterium]|nr:hypothetical protein [Campylobacterales bacterium]